MYKIILFLMILVNSLLFCSCEIGGDRVEMLNSSSNFKDADSRLVQILDFIVDKDKEGMKDIFSQQALNEDDDFDNEMAYIFEVFKGEVVSWKDSGVSVGETNEHGSKTMQVRSFYEVETDEESYVVFILEKVEDTEQPENIGIYTLRIIKAEDEDTQFEYWQEMAIPGIYMPEENLENDD